ncbi:MAG: C-terminal binding protein [Candidatus Bathyarchaeia archaeon]|nr:C-terminal binding protein [Candidatus Bathyarchaeota archaeon]
MGRFRVAITDSDYGSHEVEEEVLSSIGADLIKFQCRTEDDVIQCCSDVDGLLNQYAPITRRVIEVLQKAKIIVRYGVGVDNIDVDAATEKGIFVANVIYDVTDVADHALSLILSLARKIVWADRNVKENKWDWKAVQPISRLKDKTVGIIGFGRIGRKVAQRLRGFEVKIVAYDPYVLGEAFREYGVEKVDFETLIKESDIITIHIPLTNETRHMIGWKELRSMKREAILINVSRGGIIDEKALCKALEERWIAGAGLDVLEEEPPAKDNPLLRLDNVVITPHMAWYSNRSLYEIRRKAAEEVARALSGQIPVNLVNRDVLKKLNF